MIKQNIFAHLSLALALVGALSSCQDREDYAGPGPNERMDSQMKSTQDILIGAEHGWEMRVFPEDDVRSFGGFTSLVQFNSDGTVRAASELNHSGVDYPVEESFYTLNNTNGPTLSFDTYNENVHLYSAPGRVKYSAFSGASPRTGAMGDFNFIIVKATADSVILKGIRDKKLVVMTPLKASDWADHLVRITNGYQEYFTSTFSLTGEGVNTEVDMASNRRHIRIRAYSDELLAIRYTEDGFELYEPITLGGKSLQRFHLEGNLDDLTFKTTDGAFTLKGQEMSIAELLNTSLWSYNKVTSTGRAREGITTFERILGYFSFNPAMRATGYAIGTQSGTFAAYVTADVSGVLSGWTSDMDHIIWDIPVPMELKDLGNDTIELLYTPAKYSSNIRGQIGSMLYFGMAVKGFSNLGKIPTSGSILNESLSARRFVGVKDNPIRTRKITLTDQEDPNTVIVLTQKN